MGLSLICLVVVVLICLVLFLIRDPAIPKSAYGVWTGEAKEGESRIRRQIETVDSGLIQTPQQGYKTPYEMIEALKNVKQPKLVGYRDLISKHSTVMEVMTNKGPIQKEFIKYEMTPYKWFSSQEYYELVHRIANSLAAKGFKKGDKIAFYCETRYEWMALALACFIRGITIVTVYATLGIESLKSALRETEPNAIFVSDETIKNVDLFDLPTTTKIISCGEIKNDKHEMIEFSVLRGNEFEKVEDTPSEPDDVAFIMYTSGTTNDPKGVIALNKNVLPITYSYVEYLGYSNKSTYICYLPLAHIFELTIEFCVLTHGGSLGYSSQRTLTPTFMHNCRSDLEELEPTFMNGVPTVFNKIKKMLDDKFEKGPKVQKMLFDIGFAFKKKFYVDYQLRPPYLMKPLIKLFDLILFGKITKTIFGKRLDSVIIGGSPLSKDLQQYLQVILAGINVVQGYGSTEAVGPALIMKNFDPEYNTIGTLFPHLEYKLRDVPEMGYLTNGPIPQGELCLRGASIAKGYYKKPEETKKSFGEDGWFYTGDIVQVRPTGHVEIIDRAKNLIKQACGEYVSLEKIEMNYNANKYIDNICVFADGNYDFTVALVVLTKAAISQFGKDILRKENINTDNKDLLKEVIESEEFKKEFSKEMETCSKTLNSHEKVKRWTLLLDEWTPENGLLTAALKLKRTEISKKYQQELTTMFSLN